MKRSCWTCDNFSYDWSTGTGDCSKADDMTEEQFEKHFCDDQPDCPKWAQVTEWLDDAGGAV